MPAHYKIDKARLLVLSIGTGVLTDDDLRAHMIRLTDDYEFDPSFRQLFDLRGVTEMEVTGAGVRELARMNPWKEGAQRAVVTNSEIAFGMARMFEMLTYSKPDEIRVFREMSEALAWLGLDAIE